MQDILIRNGFLDVPVPVGSNTESILYAKIDTPIATIISNLASYGYVVDLKAFNALIVTSDLSDWWKAVEPVLKEITGADRNMGEFIVYKNFPREVLAMDVASSVMRQILIYLGVPYDFVREEEEPRPPLGDIKRLKVLSLANEDTPHRIFDNLMAMRNRWSDNQIIWAQSLVGARNAIVCSDFGFKENAIRLAAANFETKEFVPSSATDVIRLAAALSAGDVSLREKVRFRHFKRAERRRLLAALETQTNIAEDMVTRPGPWKRLMEHLRPGDYRDSTTAPYKKVMTAYDTLYNKRIKPMSALLDPPTPSLATLEHAATRPGEFLRRFHHYYATIGPSTVASFLPVMDKLTTRQLAGFRAYLRTINTRLSLIYPPKSSWSKAQVVWKQKKRIAPEDIRVIDARISEILSKRLAVAFPEGIALDMRVDNLRLQTNDQKLAEYGRGTEFDIPDDITFLRSASYWENTGMTTWFDNGWNFFDHNWKPLGACAWNDQIHSKAAVFSGDPVNARELKGRACQMVDLYLNRLELMNVRFAVWSVLCYSKVKFSDAVEVLATLQMGDKAERGKTYEPARAQMVFPLKSDALTSFVAYVDLTRRKLVYMDAPFRANVACAGMNSERLSTLMPAYVEYLASLPTLLEILQDAPSGTMPVMYDDAHATIQGGRAFVFRPERAENSFERVSLTDLVNV